MRLRVPARMPADFSWYAVLNRAGEDFYNAHTWSFAGEQTATISAVAGRDYLRLPDDFVSLAEAAGDSLGRYAIRTTTTAEVLQSRQNMAAVGPSWEWLVAFDGGWTQPTPIDWTEPRAPIYPTPTTTGAPEFTIAYRRGWRDIPEGAAAARPNIPPDCRHAFELLCRVVAWEKVFTTPSPDRPQWLERLAALIEVDDLRTGPIRPRGGVRREEPPDYVLPATWTG